MPTVVILIIAMVSVGSSNSFHACALVQLRCGTEFEGALFQLRIPPSDFAARCVSCWEALLERMTSYILLRPSQMAAAGATPLYLTDHDDDTDEASDLRSQASKNRSFCYRGIGRRLLTGVLSNEGHNDPSLVARQ
eukprot:5992213-Amphidinium_carterae.1